ncbi:hypothetical protein [Prauserella flavalba]
MLDTMHWPGEVRTPGFPFLREDVDLRLAEVRAAANMIENLRGDCEPHRYTDDHAAALNALIEARIEGRDVVQPTAAVQDEGVAELLRALGASTRERADDDRERKSVRRARAAAGKAGTAKKRAKRASGRARSAPRSDHRAPLGSSTQNGCGVFTLP